MSGKFFRKIPQNFEKISGKFLEILGNFSKKIAGHKTPNFENFRKFVNKNAIKHPLWGDIKLQKCWGSPLIHLWFVSSTGPIFHCRLFLLCGFGDNVDLRGVPSSWSFIRIKERRQHSKKDDKNFRLRQFDTMVCRNRSDQHDEFRTFPASQIHRLSLSNFSVHNLFFR